MLMMMKSISIWMAHVIIINDDASPNHPKPYSNPNGAYDNTSCRLCQQFNVRKTLLKQLLHYVGGKYDDVS